MAGGASCGLRARARSVSAHRSAGSLRMATVDFVDFSTFGRRMECSRGECSTSWAGAESRRSSLTLARPGTAVAPGAGSSIDPCEQSGGPSAISPPMAATASTGFTGRFRTNNIKVISSSAGPRGPVVVAADSGSRALPVPVSRPRRGSEA